MSGTPSRFFWYELITSDTKAASRFYSDVVGWTPEAFPGGSDYTVMNAGPGHGVAGVMGIPEEARADGTPPMWLGYIHTTDVDATANGITAAGGRTHKPPQDIPGVGRFAVVADPQGATFMIMAPQGTDREPLPYGTPGTVAWRDIGTSNLDGCFAFYSKLFGWTKGEAIPMEGMGDYQLFHAGQEMPEGGMMKSPDPSQHPAWFFYFEVDGIDAARERVVAAGGSIVMEPMEVPGGEWALDARDPQGARFGLHSARR